MIMIKTTFPPLPVIFFKDWKTIPEFHTYINGGIAIFLIDEETQDTIALATVRVGDHPKGKDTVLVKNYSENTGMETALIKANLIESTPIAFHKSGFVDIPEYTLTDYAKELIRVHGIDGIGD